MRPTEPPEPPTEGEKRRDEGIRRVTANNETWFEEAKYLAQHYLDENVGREITGEEITLAVSSRHSEETPNRYVWGALTRILVNAGRLRKTGRHALAKQPHNHARETRVYIVLF